MKNSSQITAKVIADSITPAGKRITTFELEYPRIIHSELMTHRLFSRNAMSSRAVPIKKMVEQVQNNPAMPVEFGKNKPGMQSDGEHNELICDYTPEQWWCLAAISASRFAEEFDSSGYHKQVANRLLEPFQRMKTVLTSTEFDNFWWLRVDGDADPTLYVLAKVMKELYDSSEPELLSPGEWHTPYVAHVRYDDGELLYVVQGDRDEHEMVFLSLEEAKSVSSSCCAQVSYRILNATKEKALSTYEKLVSGNKVHASPFEHVATPISETDNGSWKEHDVNHIEDPLSWEKGITHVDREGNFWSGNLCGWVQNRQLVPGNVYTG